jgi:hypothetical protein
MQLSTTRNEQHALQSRLAPYLCLSMWLYTSATIDEQVSPQ